MKKYLGFVLITGIILAGCTLGSVQTESQSTPTTISQPQRVIPSATSAPTATDSSAALQPQTVSFSARDGESLSGVFYPPTRKNAPVVILMHQYNLDLHEWDAIAPWLQNAPGAKPAQPAAAGTDPWLDASWFPELPEDFSVGVLVFTFRGCEGGCKGHSPDAWIMDAEGAFSKAASMPDVDRTRIVAIGTSIGADAAVDACSLTTPLSSLRCVGAASLSPGSYLSMPYATTAEKLAEMGMPVLCFANKGDTQSAQACAAFKHDNFTAYIDDGSLHGIMMVNPEEPTQILEVIRAYLLGL